MAIIRLGHKRFIDEAIESAIRELGWIIEMISFSESIIVSSDEFKSVPFLITIESQSDAQASSSLNVLVIYQAAYDQFSNFSMTGSPNGVAQFPYVRRNNTTNELTYLGSEESLQIEMKKFIIETLTNENNLREHPGRFIEEWE
jgi:hypothetical protein